MNHLRKGILHLRNRGMPLCRTMVSNRSPLTGRCPVREGLAVSARGNHKENRTAWAILAVNAGDKIALQTIEDGTQADVGAAAVLTAVKTGQYTRIPLRRSRW